MPDAYGPSGAVAQRPTETKKVAFQLARSPVPANLGKVRAAWMEDESTCRTPWPRRPRRPRAGKWSCRELLAPASSCTSWKRQGRQLPWPRRTVNASEYAIADDANQASISLLAVGKHLILL
jgi:hypothetical protein